MRHGGRRASEALKEKSIAGLLRSDPEGVRAAAEVLGWGGLRAEAAAQALVEGGWDRRRLVEVEVWALARSFRDPELLLARAAFRLAGSRYCKVLSALQRGRRVAGDVGRFLQVVARNHQVLRPPPQGS
jgi:hypothetical protein